VKQVSICDNRSPRGHQQATGDNLQKIEIIIYRCYM